MDIIKVFGTNLKKYRTRMGISQEDFADKCHMHRTYIIAIEYYHRSISFENIQCKTDTLKLHTYKLFWMNVLRLFALVIINYRQKNVQKENL